MELQFQPDPAEFFDKIKFGKFVRLVGFIKEKVGVIVD
jgi:RPA family protein